MPTVILADDEEFVRYFLKSVMESLDFDVVAEVEKGDELFDVLNAEQPDLLLLDVNMPNLTGTEFLEKYAANFPKTCIIMLTSSSSVKLIGETTAAGAKCFLRKDTPIDEMIYAIKETWLDFQRENK